MQISRLTIEGFKILAKTGIDSCGAINIITGPNGSGKTSTLDAIYLLSHGRSFETAKLDRLVGINEQQLTVVAELRSRGSSTMLGVAKSRGGVFEARLNRLPASKAQLAFELPTLLINASTLALVGGSSSARRQLIDWGLFHVKPDYLGLWRGSQKLAKQRGSLLEQLVRQGRTEKINMNPELDAWEKEIVRAADQIDELRAGHIRELLDRQASFQKAFERLPPLVFSYFRGWPQDIDLESCLQEQRIPDAMAGRMKYGPHRANIEIMAQGDMPAAEFLSRGQQKLVAASLKLAQGQLLLDKTGMAPVYLLDDLAAELDSGHRENLCSLIKSMGAQAFVTGVDADQLESYWPASTDIKLFHVERGVIHEQRRQ